MAIRFPPAFTQLLSVVTCADVKAVSPRMTTSYGASVALVIVEMSLSANSFKPFSQKNLRIVLTKGIRRIRQNEDGIGKCGRDAQRAWSHLHRVAGIPHLDGEVESPRARRRSGDRSAGGVERQTRGTETR